MVASESTELSRIERNGALSRGTEWTVDDLVHQVQTVQRAMKAVMKENEHFGVIPGTNKPTLLQPGAQKLCLLFRLAPSYRVTRRDLPGHHVEFEVVCELTHIPTGSTAGAGVGCCSSMETKYRWRKGAHSCPECGATAIIKGQAQYGGGWLCWAKKGGCGAKFSDDHFGPPPERVENQDIADTYNTVLKMAKKRAYVDAVLAATAASDIFTQDLEDHLHDHAPAQSSEDSPPKVGRPQTKRASNRNSDRDEQDEATKFWTEVKRRGWDKGDAAVAFDECGQIADDAIAKMENMAG